jgi:hypothetical protein
MVKDGYETLKKGDPVTFNIVQGAKPRLRFVHAVQKFLQVLGEVSIKTE